MILRNQVEWALHCCAILASLPEGRYLATKDLAEFHGVPKEYLSKALQALAQAGIVTATLGPTGGYRLARSPEKISFLEIVEAIEGEKRTFACTEIRKNIPCRNPQTKDTKVCAIARVMYRADEAWREVLKDYTLHQLLAQMAKDIPAAQFEQSLAWLLE